MARGRIAVLIPAVYDALDKEFLTGVHTAARQIGFDTLVFTSVAAENADSYTSGENNIYSLPFLTEIDGIIMAANRFHDEKLKADILSRLEKSRIPCVVVEEKHDKIKGVFLDQKKAFTILLTICLFGTVTRMFYVLRGLRTITRRKSVLRGSFQQWRTTELTGAAE